MQVYNTCRKKEIHSHTVKLLQIYGVHADQTQEYCPLDPDMISGNYTTHIQTVKTDTLCICLWLLCFIYRHVVDSRIKQTCFPSRRCILSKFTLQCNVYRTISWKCVNHGLRPRYPNTFLFCHSRRSSDTQLPRRKWLLTFTTLCLYFINMYNTLPGFCSHNSDTGSLVTSKSRDPPYRRLEKYLASQINPH